MDCPAQTTRPRQRAGILLIVCLVLAACSNSASGSKVVKPKIIRSAQFQDLKEKTAALSPYYTLPTPVEWLEFEVTLYDNSQGLPGPSDWYVDLTAKIPPETAEVWTKGLEELKSAQGKEWSRSYSQYKPTQKPKVYSSGAQTEVFWFEEDLVISVKSQTM